MNTTFTKQQLYHIVNNFTDIQDVETFSYINKKCQETLHLFTENIFINNTFTRKESKLLPNIKTIKAKMSDIVKAIGIEQALQKDIKVIIYDTDDAIQWEAIDALCTKFIHVNYFYPDFLKQDMRRLQSVFERATNVHSIVVICDAFAKILNVTEIDVCMKKYQLDYFCLYQCNLTNEQHVKTIKKFTNSLKPKKGYVFIDRAEDYNQIREIKKEIPEMYKIIINDCLLVSQANSNEVILSSVLCRKGFCIDGRIDNFSDNEQHHINEEQMKFIKLYQPTITLRYSTSQSLIPLETYHVNIIGELPNCLFDLKLIESIRFKESTKETRIDYDLSQMTTLTSIAFQSYERRERHVVFPSSLKHLDINFECEDFNERKEDQIGNSSYVPLLQPLTQLTSFTLNHYNVPEIRFPCSLISIQLKNSIIKKVSFDMTTQLKSLSIDNCHISSLTLPPTIEHVQLWNCNYLKDVNYKGNFNNCEFDIKKCPLIYLN